MFKAIYNAVAIAGILLAASVLYPEITCAQIAPGVTQSAAQTATITGTVTGSGGLSLLGVNVRLDGPGAHLVTLSDAHGTFVFASVPYGAYVIEAALPNAGSVSRHVSVHGDINVAIQDTEQTGNLKEIAQVSTSSAGAQINVTAASIASVNPTAYAFQGNTSWRGLLNGIPGVAASGGLDGGNDTFDVIPDSPTQPVILSINGALPYETSVEFDGMPLATASLIGGGAGGGANLAFLPMSMFDTADVVRGPGANAPSIVDSIGGSFVLHAPSRVDTNQFEFSASNDPYGGIVANGKVAVRFGKLSAVIAYGVNDSPGPLGSRDVIGACTQYFTSINGVPYPLAERVQTISNPNYQYNDSGFQESILMGNTPVTTSWVDHSGAIALTYDVTPSVSAQVFYTGSSWQEGEPEWVIPVDFTPGSGYTGALAPGVQNQQWVTNYEETQSTSFLEEKITADVGRGIVRLAALQNTTFGGLTKPNLLPNGEYTVYGTAVDTAGNTNVYNGTLANVTFLPHTVNCSYRTNNRDLLASYTIPIGTRSSLGISYVTSYYNSPNSGDTAYPTYNILELTSEPSAASETTNELRLYGSTDVSDRVSLNASWYFANADYHVPNPVDFDYSTDTSPNGWLNSNFSYSAPRLSGVWRASQNIAIRAAAGGGFALPQLSYLVGSSGGITCPPNSGGPYCTQSLTNLNLTPEKSFGFDFGTDMRLHSNTVLSFDLYRTDLYGQFFSSVTTGTCSTVVCGGLPLYISQEGNLSHSRYEGINLDMHHDVPHGIYWRAALGLTRGYVVSVPADFYNEPGVVCSASAPANCANTYIVPGINFDGAFQGTVPYANGSAQIGYRWGPGKYIDLSPTYFGNNNPYFEPAFIEFDAHAGYPLTKSVSLLATFRNITGIYDQSIECLMCNVEGAQNIAGSLPTALSGIPYGPRSVIVTLDFKP